MPYIYLDWNTVKYMKTHRNDCNFKTDEYFTSLIFDLVGNGWYSVPYSEAHIKDRANQYNPNYRTEVIKDFHFFEYINHSMCLVSEEKSPCFSLHSKKMIDFFDEYINTPDPVLNKEIFCNEAFSICTDLDKIGEENPLYELLESTNGNATEKDMELFLEKCFSTIFKDVDIYKKMRNYIPNINFTSKDNLISYMSNSYAKRLLIHFGPFVNSINDSETELTAKWSTICEAWFSWNTSSPISKKQILIQGYTLLDMHPLFYDKLKKRKNTLNNIIHDGLHVYYASEALYFISEDAHTRKKAKFMYDALGISTKTLSEEEFLNSMNKSSTIYL